MSEKEKQKDRETSNQASERERGRGREIASVYIEERQREIQRKCMRERAREGGGRYRVRE